MYSQIYLEFEKNNLLTWMNERIMIFSIDLFVIYVILHNIIIAVDSVHELF